MGEFIAYSCGFMKHKPCGATFVVEPHLFHNLQKRGITFLRSAPSPQACLFLGQTYPLAVPSPHNRTDRGPSCLPLSPLCHSILLRVLTRTPGLCSSVLDVARSCVRHFEIPATVAHQRGGRRLGPGSATSRRLGLRPCAPSLARVVPGEATTGRSGREALFAITLALASHTLPSSSFFRRHHLRSIRRPKSCAVLRPPQTNIDRAFKDTAFKEWKPCQ